MSQTRPDASERLLRIGSIQIPSYCRACVALPGCHGGIGAAGDHAGDALHLCLKAGDVLPDEYLKWDQRRLLTVFDGILKSFKVLAEGQRQITGFRFPGEHLLLESQEQQNPIAIQAITSATFCLISIDKIQHGPNGHGLDEDPLLAWACGEISSFHDHMLRLGCMDAATKVASFIIEMRDRNGITRSSRWRIPLPMKRHEIAEYLGLTVETISRTLGKLKADGVVAFPDIHTVEVRDPTRLQQIAGALDDLHFGNLYKKPSATGDSQMETLVNKKRANGKILSEDGGGKR